MKKNRMPSSSGGIVQYFDDTWSKLSLKPKHVIFATVILIIVVLILKWMNPFSL